MARRIGRELEVRPVERDDLRQFVERQHAIMGEDFVRRDIELPRHELRQSFRRPGVEFQSDYATAPAAFQR
jgi:hypothetical protein